VQKSEEVPKIEFKGPLTSLEKKLLEDKKKKEEEERQEKIRIAKEKEEKDMAERKLQVRDKDGLTEEQKLERE